MTERVEALIRPELLRWARESSGLSVELASSKANVSTERLASWEEGSRRPTIKQLRRLAHLYKRSLAVFYLPEVPETVPPPKDFRRLPGEVAGVESPALRLEIRKARLRREVALELLALEGEEPPTIEASVRLADEPHGAGMKLRNLLGVSLETQRQWRLPYDAFNGWRDAIERAGVLVQQMTEVELSEARGFSVAENPLPVVVANTKDSPRGRAFTLLHELTHLLLHDGGLCDLDDARQRPPELLRVERFCNAVAGAALVPRDSLLRTTVVRRHPDNVAEWADDELASLAGAFAVSREVVLRRLLDLNRTSTTFYEAKREEYLEAYERSRREREGGFAPPHQKALASAGPAFAGLVLSSYAEGHITASDLSDYLDIRLKHLPRIQERLVERNVP